MDRAPTMLFFKGETDWRPRVLRGPYLSRGGLARGELVESGASLDEIAAWVNEGGAGGEVRR